MNCRAALLNAIQLLYHGTRSTQFVCYNNCAGTGISNSIMNNQSAVFRLIGLSVFHFP